MNSFSASSMMEQFETLNYGNDGHAAGVFPTSVLSQIESYLPKSMTRTAETGCGKSTILFSNLAREHHVFAFDDRSLGERSSVGFYEGCSLTKRDRIVPHFGPTQKTVPTFSHLPYDAVLIDGPHGWPFPELEYYFFYPHIVTGGILIIDDVPIPTIGRMADILAEDDMWNLVGMAGVTTAIFRRTNAPTMNPFGDDWWTQKFNRHRVSSKRDIYLSKSDLRDEVSSLRLDEKLHG